MKKVTILTLAHNSESFIRETIESVLGQSEADFDFVIRNNGSTDRTGEIIREYMKKDSRIVLLENQENYITDDGVSAKQRGWWPEFNSEYIAILDHDDILDKNFLKEMYQAAKQHNADMVMSGCFFFQGDRKKVLGTRNCPDFVINDLNEFEPYFIPAYGCLRTQWGKLFRAETYSKLYEHIRKTPSDLSLCSDTYMLLEALEFYPKVIGISKPLMYYRIGFDSQFNTQIVNRNRIHDGIVLFQKAFDLLNKHQILSKRNLQFLFNVYSGHFIDTLLVLAKSQKMSYWDKIKYIEYMLADPDNMLTRYRHTAFNALSTYIEQCLLPLPSLQSAFELHTCYLYRLYFSLTGASNLSNRIMLLIGLGALTDDENPLFYGEDFLFEKYSNAFPEREKILLSLNENARAVIWKKKHLIPLYLESQHPKDSEERQLEQLLIESIENADYDKSETLLELLSHKTITSEVFIFCQLLLLLERKQINEALLLAPVARTLWPNSNGIQSLYEQLICY